MHGYPVNLPSQSCNHVADEAAVIGADAIRWLFLRGEQWALCHDCHRWAHGVLLDIYNAARLHGVRERAS